MVSDAHSAAQDLSGRAALALREGHRKEAEDLFLKAADLEQRALAQVPPEKIRTRGILAVSLASLYFKAHDYAAAERVAAAFLAIPDLLEPARLQLRELLESAWDENLLAQQGREYSGEELRFALRGGLIGSGTAPAFVALDSFEGTTSLVYRAAEYAGRFAFRRRGLPPADVRDAFEARATQPGAGSFFFAVKLTQPKQVELFEGEIPKRRVAMEAVSGLVLDLVRAANEGDPARIEKLVEDPSYRDVFLKLLRRIAPNEKAFTEVQISRITEHGTESVSLTRGTKDRISEVLHKDEPGEGAVEIRGILRGLSLDGRWLEIRTEDGAQHWKTWIRTLLVDDVIGPMVNHHVIARCLKTKPGRLDVTDIQLDDEKE